MKNGDLEKRIFILEQMLETLMDLPIVMTIIQHEIHEIRRIIKEYLELGASINQLKSVVDDRFSSIENKIDASVETVKKNKKLLF